MVFGNANFVEANHPLVTVDSIKHVGEQEPGGLTLVRGNDQDILNPRQELTQMFGTEARCATRAALSLE